MHVQSVQSVQNYSFPLSNMQICGVFVVVVVAKNSLFFFANMETTVPFGRAISVWQLPFAVLSDNVFLNKCISDAFTSEILNIWSEISYNGYITSTEHLLSLPLWQNSLVRTGNKPVYYKSWSSKGIQNVRHLMKDADNFLSFTELKERFDVKTNFLVYHGLVSCIKLLRNAIQNQNETNRTLSSFVENFIKAPKSNRLAYKKLVSAKQSSPRRSQQKWSADCNLQCSRAIDWEMAYKLPFYSTKATKLFFLI